MANNWQQAWQGYDPYSSAGNWNYRDMGGTGNLQDYLGYLGAAPDARMGKFRNFASGIVNDAAPDDRNVAWNGLQTTYGDLRGWYNNGQVPEAPQAAVPETIPAGAVYTPGGWGVAQRDPNNPGDAPGTGANQVYQDPNSPLYQQLHQGGLQNQTYGLASAPAETPAYTSPPFVHGPQISTNPISKASVSTGSPAYAPMESPLPKPVEASKVGADPVGAPVSPPSPSAPASPTPYPSMGGAVYNPPSQNPAQPPTPSPATGGAYTPNTSFSSGGAYATSKPGMKPPSANDGSGGWKPQASGSATSYNPSASKSKYSMYAPATGNKGGF
jgi:hypothetical protein